MMEKTKLIRVNDTTAEEAAPCNGCKCFIKSDEKIYALSMIQMLESHLWMSCLRNRKFCQ